MTGNNVNLPSGGNGTATPSDSLDDNLDAFDFEEQDRPAKPQPEEEKPEGEEETTEAEGQEVENPEEEPEEEAEDKSEEAEKPLEDDVTVKLPSGESVPLAELKNGYMRDRDYRIKTTQVAETRRNLEAEAERVSRTVDVFADFLAKQLPPPPNDALIFTDPQQHYSQKVVYESALGQLQALINLANAPKEATAKLNQDQLRETLATENARLAERFPMTTTEKGRNEFFNRGMKQAIELGFTPEEIAKKTDHREFALAYLASIGAEALEAKKAAKSKVQGAPPVSPPRRQGTQSVMDTKARNEAKQRLRSTGRLDDALALID